MSTCPDCGLSLSERAGFCPTCGWRESRPLRQELPHYPGDPEEGDVSPWRPYLAYVAFAAVMAAVNVAYFLGVRASPPWFRDTWRLTITVWAILQLVAVAVAVEAAAVIHPPTARQLEFSHYRAPDHESPRQRERRVTWRLAVVMLGYFALTLLLFVLLERRR